jgi:hypothetical protein
MESCKKEAAVDSLAAFENPETQTSSVVEPSSTRASQWVYLKHYFTSREGWVGDYVNLSSIYHKAF